MFYYSILFTLISQVVMFCDQNCASCRDITQNDTYCLACNEGYTQTQTSLCNPENTIANCATYDQSLNCLVCKPTFQTVWNVCQRTFTGCLIFKNNKCFQCLPGAVLNNNTGTCSIQYLNCISISSNGVCTGCQAKYVLRNGRCTYQNNSCIFVDKNTGLCAQCALNSVLIGATCVPLQVKLNKNCYLIDDNSLNVSCKYCKQGYGIYQGSCIILTKIINLTQNINTSCLDPEYLELNQANCANISVQNCQIVDFGLSVCVFCNPGYDLINGTCIAVVDNFCQTFNANGKGCLRCKQTFYLKNSVCVSFPPYCISYSFTCTQCQINFELINGNCVDPYCQTVNPITRACQICLPHYKLNPYGVCKFIDPNCVQFNESGDCASCVKGYSIRSSLQYCAYQDLNCLVFYNTTGGCKMCKPFFAYNQQVQLCVPLPDHCETADLSGKCSKCVFNYNLVSDYTCLFIPSVVANCQVINKDDYLKCTLCTNGSYADQNGVCRDLPAFCAVYDSLNNQCQQCQDNGMMKNGNCVDKNCQIFDLQGGCLACITSYQFNSFGQCIFTPKDPNCKQFVYGICKSCKQRYYFDFQFVCTAVSPLCKTYDANSGRCLSCYDGYELNLNGGCFLNIYNSIVGNDDLLGSSCKKYNSKGECMECYFGYEAVKMNSSVSGVNCIQSNDSTQHSYCISPNRENGKCLECVYRMFVNDSGECQSIDENCNDYNKSNGVCVSCYPGYTNQMQNNRTKCVIIIDADPNCQTKGNASCLKCYSGFYYSVQSIKCVQANQLCQTYNQTNGDCLSCYSGYTLNKRTCQVSANTPNTNNSNKSSNAMQPGCNQLNLTTKQCTNCDWGFTLINGTCIQRDLNCEVFLNPNSLICLSCYSGYKTFGADQTKCILSTLIAQHCLKYSPDLQCILCENGYILSKSSGTSPLFVCSIIDQNCALFNSTLNQCQKCVEGAVLSGRFCIVPTYGIDQNCVLYTNKLCSACKNGYSLSAYVCTQS